MLFLFCQNVDAQGISLVKGYTSVFPDGTKIILRKRIPFNSIYKHSEFSDTTVLKNGEFSFRILANNPELYILSFINKQSEKWCRVFIQPGNLQITFLDTLLGSQNIKFNQAGIDYYLFEKSIKLSSSDTSLQRIRKKIALNIKDDSISRQQYNIYSKEMDDSISAKTSRQVFNWLKKNPRSTINSYIIYDYLKKITKDSELENLFQGLHYTAKANSWGKELDYMVNKLSDGKKAPNFASTDTSGKMKSLSDFHGKYLLLEFWASWCKPCREKTPALLKIYEKYKGNSFEIIGISLDKSKADWQKAIKEEGITWTQVSDLLFWQNKVALDYNITAIPYNILLDKKGIIIAKNIWGNDLMYLLDKVLR